MSLANFYHFFIQYKSIEAAGDFAMLKICKKRVEKNNVSIYNHA